nr:hypothetical protein [Paenibacillus sp. CH40]
MILQGDIVEVDLRPSSDTPTHHLVFRSESRIHLSGSDAAG